MDLEQYWAIVEKARPKSNDPEVHIDALERALKKLPAEEIIGFEVVNSGLMNEAYRADLWDMAYTINGGCSDDGFIDFRSWLTMQGRDVYEAALADPQTLVEINAGEGDLEEEGYGYVAMHAYEEVTGKEWDPDLVGGWRAGKLKLRGRWTKSARGFRRKFPMAYRVIHETPAVEPAWLKWDRGTVKKIARSIRDERRCSDLSVLADALEEAGCEDAFILGHLREGRRHARSCWVTYLILKPA